MSQFWGMSSRGFISAGKISELQGRTGVRDISVEPDVFLNQDGIVELESVINERTGLQITGLAPNIPCDYVDNSNGVHGFQLETPEFYGLQVGDVCKAKLVARAALLLTNGETARFLRLRVVER